MVSVIAGSVITDDPRAPVTGCKVIDPEVRLENTAEPTLDPETPKLIEVVNVGVPVRATLPVPETE